MTFTEDYETRFKLASITEFILRQAIVVTAIDRAALLNAVPPTCRCEN
jgi:hypothetical protein